MLAGMSVVIFILGLLCAQLAVAASVQTTTPPSRFSFCKVFSFMSLKYCGPVCSPR
jgi:hypothetical protein